jgi:hypothetical protein
MMLSGDRPRKLVQLDALLEGYQEFNSFDPAELRLIEPVAYPAGCCTTVAWLASRWG